LHLLMAASQLRTRHVDPCWLCAPEVSRRDLFCLTMAQAMSSLHCFRAPSLSPPAQLSREEAPLQHKHTRLSSRKRLFLLSLEVMLEVSL